MWPFSRQEKQESDPVVIIDIGSGSVGCAVVRTTKGGAPLIGYADRAHAFLPTHEPRTAPRLMDRLYGVARSTFERATSFIHFGGRERAGNGAKWSWQPQRIFIFLGAPWYSPYIRNLRHITAAPEHVDNALVDRLLADYMRRQQPEEYEVIIERSIAGIRLNGYPVPELPQRARATSIELTALTTTAHRPFLHSLRDEARRAFGTRASISFHAADPAHAHSLSSLRPNSSDFLLCNGEGEVTNLLAVREHAPVGAATAQAGSHILLHSLAASANMDHREALAHLAWAQDPRHNTSHMSAIREAQRACIGHFDTALAKVTPVAGNMPTLYTLADTAGGEAYASAIAGSPLLAAHYPLGIAHELVDRSWMAPMRAVGQERDVSADPSLQLETLFANSLMRA